MKVVMSWHNNANDLIIVRPDGLLDESSLHGACPVLKVSEDLIFYHSFEFPELNLLMTSHPIISWYHQGTKWGANLWVWNGCRYSQCKGDPLNPAAELPDTLKAPFPGGI